MCQAGIILDTLERHVEQFGYTVPLDLGAKGRFVTKLTVFIFVLILLSIAARLVVM